MLRRFCQLFTIGVSLAIPTAILPAQAQYARFTRTTDTIHILGNTQLGGGATYEARVWLVAGNGGYVLNEWISGLEDKVLKLGATYVSAFSFRIAGTDFMNQSANIPLNTWVHVAYVYDGVQERLYLSGVLIGSRIATGSILNATGSNFAVGANMREVVYPSFIGLLDTVRISSIARYSGNSFIPPTGDLTADTNTQLLYNFNEPLGSTSVTDLSPQGNNGTFGVGFSEASSPEIVSDLPSVSVSGIIALQGTQDTVQPIEFTFRSVTGTAFTRNATLNFGNGLASYSFPDIPSEDYTLSIKGVKWLRKNITVNASTGNVTNANATLLAGDANNDNFADIADLLLLISAYNQVAPDAGYSDVVDFSCDGVNDISDLLLLIVNYNKQGNS